MLNFLYTAVSWVLLRWHDLFSTIGLAPGSGLTWALSIFMLVVTIRILLFRFFIKQVHSQRKMQEVQPKIAALREKYKNDRQTLSQEMMKLQKEEGFNPLGGCLPILMQAPVFFALFHVLRLVGSPKSAALYEEYGWSRAQAASAGEAKLFGGAPIPAAFNTPLDRLAELGGDLLITRIVAGVLIVLMVAATYITQRQIISRNTQVLDGQQAMIQKLLLYGMPASLFVSGFFFPIGVLLYWFTNNLWTMGQQFYILKRMPHPNAKKDESRPSIDPKLLAPKPGQKPVRPPRRSAAAPAGDDGAGTGPAGPEVTADGATSTPNGKVPGAGPPAGKPPRGKGAAQTDAAGTASPDGAVPVAGETAADGTEGTDGADGAEKPAPPPRGAKTGSGGRPGGGRRPQGQRSPTQTRQKKKRR